MKPQELRIGNLVILSISNVSHYGKIHSLTPSHLLIGDSIKCDYCDLQPILLTKEWFLKLGFTDDRGVLFELPIHIQEKCKGDKGFKKSAFFFNNREDVNMWMDCQTRVCVKYVHEVQNLVYALTGEELEVKL